MRRDAARKQARGQGARGQGGFTLIEALIAVTILGLLMAGIAAGVRFAVRAREAQHHQTSAFVETDAVQGLVRSLLGGARPLDPRSDGGADAGGRHRFTFLGRLPAPLDLPRTVRMTLECAGDRLQLRWDGEGGEGGGGTAKLLDGLAGCAFAFWEPATPERPERTAGWREAWRDPTRLPVLVSVRLTFPPGDRRVWAPLVAAPMMAD